MTEQHVFTVQWLADFQRRRADGQYLSKAGVGADVDQIVRDMKARR